jgi:hypothetical protein
MAEALEAESGQADGRRIVTWLLEKRTIARGRRAAKPSIEPQRRQSLSSWPFHSRSAMVRGQMLLVQRIFLARGLLHMNAYAWPHEFDGLGDRPGFFRRVVELLLSILSGGNSGWEAGARGF